MNLTDIVKLLEKGKQFSEKLEQDGEVVGEIILRRPRRKYLTYALAGATALVGLISQVQGCKSEPKKEPEQVYEHKREQDIRQYYVQETESKIEFIIPRSLDTEQKTYVCSKPYRERVEFVINSAQRNDVQKEVLKNNSGVRSAYYASEIADILFHVSVNSKISETKVDRAVEIVKAGGGLTELRGEQYGFR